MNESDVEFLPSTGIRIRNSNKPWAIIAAVSTLLAVLLVIVVVWMSVRSEVKFEVRPEVRVEVMPEIKVPELKVPALKVPEIKIPDIKVEVTVDQKPKLSRAAQHLADNYEDFNNKADFDGWGAPLKSAMISQGYCTNTSHNVALLIGGLNEGQLASVMTSDCPAVTLFGFEIQPAALAKARERVNGSRVFLEHLGMSDAEGELYYAGEGEIASFFTPSDGKRFSDWNSSAKAVPVTTLRVFFEKRAEAYAKQGLEMPKLIYSVIDTEGHEPMVMMGMGLQHEKNRKRFSAFQLEFGGTWAVDDPRHPLGSLSQIETVAFLRNRGYKTYLIGEKGLLEIVPTDLESEKVQRNEGTGAYVHGNLLVVHPAFADPLVLHVVKEREIVFPK